MEWLAGTTGACHQNAHFRKSRTSVVAKAANRALHVLPISAGVTGLVARQQFIDMTDHWFVMPSGCTHIPLGQTDLSTKVKHQGLKRRGRVELESYGV